MRNMMALGLLAVLPALSGAAADPEFGSYWHDGKAELDGYRLTVERYGHTRQGRAVAIYVTEPFSRTRHVKLDDPARSPKDAVEVLKLNLMRDFQNAPWVIPRRSSGSAPRRSASGTLGPCEGSGSTSASRKRGWRREGDDRHAAGPTRPR